MINVTLFKFDYETDYLPYYKHYSFKQNASLKTIEDVLNHINSIEPLHYLQNENFFLQINKQFTSSKTLLSDVLDTSDTIILEPLSIKRAKKDLIIDTKDYKEKLNLLDAYISESEKEKIIQDKTYMLEYYASNTFNFHDDYIGEHVILLGLDIVKQDTSLQDEIFELLNSEDGIINKSSLKYRILNYPRPGEYTNDAVSTIVQPFTNFNIALYCGLNTPSFENIIIQSEAKYIDLNSKHFDIPLGAKKLSYLMAGTVLLEAMDNNADFLIVHDVNDLELFDSKQKTIEKAVGREINLPVLTRSEFLKLLEGEKNKNTLGLNTHKVKIPFLES